MAGLLLTKKVEREKLCHIQRAEKVCQLGRNRLAAPPDRYITTTEARDATEVVLDGVKIA